MIWQYSSGAFMGWALGANDAANVFGTSVATRLVSYRLAVIILALFILLGAVLEGPKCMTTVNEITPLDADSAFLVTLSAGIVMWGFSALALPASSSQALIGALLFIGLAGGNAQWGVLLKIAVCWLLTPISAAILSVLLYLSLGRLMRPVLTDLVKRTTVLRWAVVIAGCYGSYTLGSNNVANVSGVYVGSGLLTSQQASIFGGLAIALGVVTYSRRVMMTVGQGIVPLDAFSAFINVMALAASAHLFTQIGVPVSSTQAVVGSVLGIGLLKNSSKINARTVVTILLGWVATPLAGGLICLLLFNLRNGLF